MRRALRIGIFIGTLIGVSACASADPVGERVASLKEIVAKPVVFG